MRNHHPTTLCECIRKNNIRQICSLLCTGTTTLIDPRLLSVCVMENRPLALHHLLRYVDQDNVDVYNTNLLRLAVRESKQDIVDYLLNVHCIGTPNVESNCAQHLQHSDSTLRIICNHWDYIYCKYLNTQQLTNDDFLQAVTNMKNYENGNVMFAAMLEGGVNYPLVCKYTSRIIDNLYGKKRMSMFKTLINYLKENNHSLDVSGCILKAVQLDYHEALHTIMEVYSKIHVDNCIGKYTLLQWSILCGSMGRVVYLRDRHATFDIKNSDTIELVSNCNCSDLLDVLPWQELRSLPATTNTLLQLACSYENYCVVKYLVDNNVAVPHLCDAATPLDYLIYKHLQFCNNLESVQLLIQLGASLDDVPNYLLQKCFYKNTTDTLEKLLYIDDPNCIRGIDYSNCKMVLKQSHLPVDIVRHVGSFLDSTFFSPPKSTELVGQINANCDDILRKYLSLYSMQSI